LKTEIFLAAGKVHPLLVHLPVGIICTGVIFYFLSHLNQLRFLYQSIFLIFCFGFFTSLISALSGYLLSRQGSYNSDHILTHQYAGILTTIFSGFLTLQFKKLGKDPVLKFRPVFSIQLIILLVIIIFTGHQGGTLTHGDDYLSISKIKNNFSKPASVEQAILYEQIIAPVLEKRCRHCHGSSKQKGGLSMMTLNALLKGGESGPAIIPGKPEESELIKRISLSPAHEDFMPAEGKTPLTQNESDIIRWWIKQGEPLKGKKLIDYPNQIEINAHITAYLGFETSNNSSLRVNQEQSNNEIDIIKTKSIETLRKKGMMVRILQHIPLLIDVTIPPKSNPDLKQFTNDIQSIQSDIIWLKMSENNLKESELGFLKTLTNLQKLRLEKNPIGDGIAEHLKDLKKLEALNLTETNITPSGLKLLQASGHIKRIYCWHTSADSENP
jgi:uncharacterized membrane protein